MRDVSLTVGTGDDAAQVTLAGAWLDDDGGHGVEARAEVPGPPPLEITGHRSSWSLRDGVMVFEERVEAVRGPVTLTCDRLEVRYAEDRVSVAVATGSVRVSRAAREARADRATLTVADGQIALEGSPVLLDGSRTLRGERIVLFLDDERIECEACTLTVAGEAVGPP